MAENTTEAYERGLTAGTIDARLAGHDMHLNTISGNIERLADELHDMTLAVQRLGDQAVSRDATVITTAAALKEAETIRRHASDSAWSPINRLSVIIGAAVGVATLMSMFYLAVR
jgi:hypothetical protein